MDDAYDTLKIVENPWITCLSNCVNGSQSGGRERFEHLKVAKGYNGQGIMNGHDCPYPEGIYDILL